MLRLALEHARRVCSHEKFHGPGHLRAVGSEAAGVVTGLERVGELETCPLTERPEIKALGLSHPGSVGERGRSLKPLHEVGLAGSSPAVVVARAQPAAPGQTPAGRDGAAAAPEHRVLWVREVALDSELGTDGGREEIERGRGVGR